jgi:exopolysaccharide biosynthesis polyprenyl glycosylphosphotransferase
MALRAAPNDTVPIRARRSAPSVRARKTSSDWPIRYASRLFYSDLSVIALTLGIYAAIAFDDVTANVDWPTGPTIPYWLAIVILGGVWLAALDAIDTRDRHTVGNGITEYRRIVNATLAVFALLLGVAFFLRIDLARSIFFVALPVGLVLLIVSRWAWRQWLRARQRSREYVYRAVVIGDASKVAHVISSIRRTEGTGFDIVGALTDSFGSPTISGVPIIGSYHDSARAMDAVDADTLIVAGADDLDPKTMRRMGWSMADRDINLVVAPALTDVAGPRIHARPAAGLPLVHVEFPTMDGYKRFLKRTFDLATSTVIIIVLAPVFIAVALAIKFDGRGPLFYRQTRVGLRGREFGMIKFRSMIADADDQLASLLDVQGTTDRPLFKVTNDPRITRVGRFLRKHSIDELPQLFNVFIGDMSLVGPRPQVAGEVALYDDDAHRRLLVKPGMSGLWQVSGRSLLSWEDSLRLDLYYVENWSFTQDLQILFRTVRAVVAPGQTAS